MKWNDGLETTLSKKEDSRLTEDKNLEEWNYGPIDMKKSVILERFRKNGGRVTRQRELLIDIILQEQCTSCKEIYVLASRKDPGIGIATVYRMIRSLEELGALKRKNTVSDFLKWPAFDLTDCPSIAHFSVRQRFNDTGADAPVQSNHFSR